MLENSNLKVGVLAIQGAVEEHFDALRALGAKTKEIRYPEDFKDLDGIILPGGESTTMSIVGESTGLFPHLKEWVLSDKPVWGTCAGMILLSNHAIKKAESGQSLVGGLDVYVCRNYFGSQIHSCVIDIETPSEIQDHVVDDFHKGDSTYPAVFIRAPAILKVGPTVNVLSKVMSAPHPSAVEDVEKLMEDLYPNEEETGAIKAKRNKKQKISSDSSGSLDIPKYEVIVAVRKHNILATAFHPELTPDLRWHRYFLKIVQENKSKT